MGQSVKLYLSNAITFEKEKTGEIAIDEIYFF
jgi:hypothetical protein